MIKDGIYQTGLPTRSCAPRKGDYFEINRKHVRDGRPD